MHLTAGHHSTMAILRGATTALVLVVLPLAAAHSNLIKPKPRNAIDSELPEWKDGNAPYYWVPSLGKSGTPCACRNGTDVCAPAQTCLWFTVGTTIGCSEPDGGDNGPSNPNRQDRCGSGMKATINDPKHRTVNRDAEAGSDADWTKFVRVKRFSTSRLERLANRPSVDVRTRGVRRAPRPSTTLAAEQAGAPNQQGARESMSTPATPNSARWARRSRSSTPG